MSTPDDFNARIIEEFRANGGRVGGPFENSHLLLLHHVGARSGTERVNPLAYLKDGERWVVFGSKAGAPSNPDWLHNLRAHPDTSIEVGADTIDVIATVATGEERERLFNAQAAAMPVFAGYQEKTERIIPVVVLSRR
jgi:deazaflavin-dependent oxidoreductase (nitroreductase family)